MGLKWKQWIIWDENEVRECWKNNVEDLYWNDSGMLKNRIEKNAIIVLKKSLLNEVRNVVGRLKYSMTIDDITGEMLENMGDVCLESGCATCLIYVWRQSGL